MLFHGRLGAIRPVARVSSGFETTNRRVQRLGRTHGIEIFAEERDLPSDGAQKHNIVLPVNAPSRLDESLCLDFADCRCRIGDRKIG